MRRLIALSAALGGLGACTDPARDQAADLHRPSGLAVASRPAPAAGQARADIYIADAEAQGVRIRQSWRRRDTERDRDLFSASFIKAPIVFFPLRISTPGFPSRLSLSVNADADRLFVIAAAGQTEAGNGLLYVLNTAELPYGANIEDAGDTNRRLGEVALSTYLGPQYYPVDVLTLGYREADQQDVVGVLMNDISGGPSQLLALVLDRSPDGVSVIKTATAPLLPGAQRVIRYGEGRLAASSALSDNISQLSYTLTSSVGFGTVHTLAAGGPTSELIDGGTLGVFAVRLDRSALTVFTAQSGGALAASTQSYDSPYLTEAERLTPTPGQIRLHAEPVVTGARGQVAQLVAVNSEGAHAPLFAFPEDADARPLRDVVALFHLGGRSSFIVPDASGAPRLALSDTAAVSWLRKLPGPSAVKVTECDLGDEVPECAPNNNSRSKCAAGVVTQSFPDAREYHAVYRGDLYWGVGENLVFEAASGSDGATVQLRSEKIDFNARAIQVGDPVRVQLRYRSCTSGDSEGRDYQQDAAVTAVSADVVKIALPAVPPALLSCLTEQGFVEANRVEIYPAGEDAVLSQRKGQTIVKVLQRVAVTGSGAARSVRFEGQDLAGDSLPVAFTMAGDLRCLSAAEADPDDAAYRRDASVPGDAVMSRICSVQADCGKSRGCFPAATDSDGCLLMCEGRCEADTCVRDEQVRFCAGVRMRVAATEVAGPRVRIPYRYGSYGGQEYVNAGAPAAAAFSPADQGWVVSYPGNRSLVSLRAAEDAIVVSVTR